MTSRKIETSAAIPSPIVEDLLGRKDEKKKKNEKKKQEIA